MNNKQKASPVENAMRSCPLVRVIVLKWPPVVQSISLQDMIPCHTKM